MRRLRRRRWVLLATGLAVAALVGLFIWWLIVRIGGGVEKLSDESSTTLTEPEVKVVDVATGLERPWDIAFPTREVMFYSLKSGEIKGRMLSSGEEWTLIKPSDLKTSNEGGMLGLALDSSYADSHYLFACYTANADKGPDVRVVRYKVSNDLKQIEESVPIVASIESNNGQHSGCQVVVDKLGNVWIGTGDGGIATAAQNPKSLAGKILRVTKDGDPVAGNLKDPFDERIFSYGHRNVQGLVITDKPLNNGAYGYSVEQGNSQDDELNYLVPGNFGWDPNENGKYAEESTMTNLAKYADAVRSVWSTGPPSLGFSGVERLTMKRWQAWRGRLIIAGLGSQEARLVEVNERGEYLSDKALFTGKYGRLRTFVEGQDGNLYAATDNGGGQDKIIKIQVICTVCD